MSVFDTLLEFTDAFVTGYNAVTGMGLQGNRLVERGDDEEPGRLERLCRELAWGVADRAGGTVLLRFNHPQLGPRDVRVLSGDECLARFLVYSHALPPADNVSEEVLGHLLHQNVMAPMGCWFADVLEDGRAIFGLRYEAARRGPGPADTQVPLREDGRRGVVVRRWDEGRGAAGVKPAGWR